MSERLQGAPSQEHGGLPAEAGVWVFIAGDAILFSLLFGMCLYYRTLDPALYASSQAQLSEFLGLLNTLLMLTSSWWVATGVHLARLGRALAASWMFYLGAACGLLFMVVKYFEYGPKIRAGITLSTNDFFMLYFVYTGIHLIHVVIGTGVLIAMAVYVRSQLAKPTAVRNLESGATFWHLVDLLWIALFALLYLIH